MLEDTVPLEADPAPRDLQPGTQVAGHVVDANLGELPDRSERAAAASDDDETPLDASP